MMFGILRSVLLSGWKDERSKRGKSPPPLWRTYYRYLRVLELDVIHNKQMKTLVSAEYYKRVKKILKSGLKGKNNFQAINSWAVPVAR